MYILDLEELPSTSTSVYDSSRVHHINIEPRTPSPSYCAEHPIQNVICKYT